jgi:CrcB protein
VVLAGAGLGGVARYAAGTWIMAKYGGRFPLGTFLINVSGSFLIGILMALLTERFQPHPNWRLFLVTGVLGGYTTFSSFEYETLQAVRGGAYWMGMLYVGGSVVLGYLGVWLGALLGSSR